MRLTDLFSKKYLKMTDQCINMTFAYFCYTIILETLHEFYQYSAIFTVGFILRKLMQISRRSQFYFKLVYMHKHTYIRIVDTDVNTEGQQSVSCLNVIIRSCELDYR